MTKNPKKKAPKTKPRRAKAGGPTLRIRISASKRNARMLSGQLEEARHSTDRPL